MQCGRGRSWGWGVVWLVCGMSTAAQAANASGPPAQQRQAKEPPPAAAFETPASRWLARNVLAVADHRGGPFAIVDKQAATITVYRADGTLAGVSAVLLGRAPGDHSVPGVGERAQLNRLRPGDRTTAAGRFDSEPGRNASGEAIVWLDYDNALAIHRLRPGPAREQRAARLASTNLQDRRISSGCVVVPGAFFDAVVQPLLGRVRGVVYVMPEDGGAGGLVPPGNPGTAVGGNAEALNRLLSAPV